VIGGGDFAKDRLVPDLVAAIRRRAPLRIRYPDAIRPWQHVLEPLSGYLLLAEKLWADPVRYSRGWNFGPDLDSARPVRWIVEEFRRLWGERLRWELDGDGQPSEDQVLSLDSTHARTLLGWRPRWTLEMALRSIVQWYEAYDRGSAVRQVVSEQISAYESGHAATASAVAGQFGEGVCGV